MEKHLLFKRFADKRLHLGVCGSVGAIRAAAGRIRSRA